MDKVTRVDQHDEVELLLPWFVNDTLSERERHKVAEHIENCQTCRESVDLLDAVSDTVHQAPATPIVAEPKIDRLLQTIDGKRQSYRRNRALTMAAVAASSAIIALFLVQFFGGTQTPARFETATSARVETQTDYVLNIVFESGSAEVDRDRVMRLIEAREVSRTNNNDIYRVTVSLPASSFEELQRFTDDVESLPDVRSVEVIAVQLPVRPQQ